MAASRRRGPRRADAPGTGPASADGPEPRLPGTDGPGQRGGPPPPQTTRTTGVSGAGQEGAVVGKEGRTLPAAGTAEPTDALGRWLLEQRPPHWG